jgi:hypothetical protein
MKNLFLTLVVFSLALIIGCQENQITDPNTSLEKTSSGIQMQIMKICCQVNDPLSGCCGVNGSVRYMHKVTNQNTNSVNLKKVSLHLEMESELCSRLGMVHLPWIVKGISDDTFYVSEEGIVLLEKSYRISNRYDVVMSVVYLVTTEGVGISSVSLIEVEK